VADIDTIRDEAQIRQLIEDWTASLQAKNLDALMSHYTPDVLLYDLAPPLANSGAHVLRKGLAEWLGTFVGPVGFEVRNLSITIGGDVAFSTCLERISGRRTSGEQTDVWVRSTVGYRKIGGTWMITHEHTSVPFYMDGSDKAAVDLKP
jgi:ketosteroid isomerase-like protein